MQHTSVQVLHVLVSVSDGWVRVHVVWAALAVWLTVWTGVSPFRTQHLVLRQVDEPLPAA